MNVEHRMNVVCLFKKNRAKPSARRGYSAYASESDIHHSSFVVLHSSFNEVPYLAKAAPTHAISAIKTAAACRGMALRISFSTPEGEV